MRIEVALRDFLGDTVVNPIGMRDANASRRHTLSISRLEAKNVFGRRDNRYMGKQRGLELNLRLTEADREKVEAAFREANFKRAQEGREQLSLSAWLRAVVLEAAGDE